MIVLMPRKKKTHETKQIWLSPKELVERWRGRITERTMAQWRWKKHGPKATLLGAKILYALEDVEAFETAERLRGERASTP